jgi:hypothetical protein
MERDEQLCLYLDYALEKASETKVMEAFTKSLSDMKVHWNTKTFSYCNNPIKTRSRYKFALGSFRFDYEYEYEYEIRQAKRMLYAYAIPHWREKVVAVAHLSTKFVEKSRSPHDDFSKKQRKLLFLFSKNNL